MHKRPFTWIYVHDRLPQGAQINPEPLIIASLLILPLFKASQIPEIIESFSRSYYNCSTYLRMLKNNWKWIKLNSTVKIPYKAYNETKTSSIFNSFTNLLH